MRAGDASSGGRSWSSVDSIAGRTRSRNRDRSLFIFSFERNRLRLSGIILQEYLHTPLGLLQFAMAEARKFDAFLKQLEGRIQGQFSIFKLLDDFLETLQRCLEVRSLRHFFDRCALSGLHSLRSFFYWLRPVGLAFAPLIFLLAAPRRACIRSAHFLTGCALSGLHSLRSFSYWLRPVGLAFAPLMTGIVDDLDYNRKGPRDSYESCSSSLLFFSSYKLRAETGADCRSGNRYGEKRITTHAEQFDLANASGPRSGR